MADMTKIRFLEELKKELEKQGVTDGEIIEDFEQHFEMGVADGLSEEEVCKKLGSPSEIASQYTQEAHSEKPIEENGESGFAQNSYTKPVQYKKKKRSGAKIAGIICLDIFILVWAVPLLFSLLIVYWAVMISLFVSGAALIFAPAINSAVGLIVIATPFVSAVNIFAGIAVIGIALIMAAFCFSIWRGGISVVGSIARLHKSVFSSGGKEVAA